MMLRSRWPPLPRGGSRCRRAVARHAARGERRRRRELHQGLAGARARGPAHGRDRLARLPAVLREQQAGQRQGLRERRRLRGRRPARLHAAARSSGRSSRSTAPTRPGRRRSTSTSTRSRSRRARAKEVDFSTPYYTNPQAIIVVKGSPYAHATSAGGAASGAKFGVQIGTTSLSAVDQRDQADASSRRSSTTPTTSSARCKIGRVEAIVVDLATAFDLTSGEIPHGDDRRPVQRARRGQLGPAARPRARKLTPCVDKAVGALRANGTLAATHQALDAVRRPACPVLK